MNPSDALQAAQEAGFKFPTPWWIFGCIVFGLVGLAAWRYGKVVRHPRTRWLGVALMFYPYLTQSTWLLYGVGFALCAVIWWDRPRED